MYIVSKHVSAEDQHQKLDFGIDSVWSFPLSLYDQFFESPTKSEAQQRIKMTDSIKILMFVNTNLLRLKKNRNLEAI